LNIKQWRILLSTTYPASPPELLVLTIDATKWITLVFLRCFFAYYDASRIAEGMDRMVLFGGPYYRVIAFLSSRVAPALVGFDFIRMNIQPLETFFSAHQTQKIEVFISHKSASAKI
jgi:hypothetical protein